MRYDLLQDYTDDSQLLTDALNRIRAGGGTRLYDALCLTAQKAVMESDERKVVVVLTDGDDNSSRMMAEEVIEAAQRNNVTIYGISTNRIEPELVDTEKTDQVFKLIAGETGGEVLFPASLRQLAHQFKRISRELRSQYTLAYRSTNLKRDGSFRKILIKPQNDRYSVRARSGYYAPQQRSAERN